MKKGLLLSVVASGILFAGGDIAPVQPVQPTVAPASCDFWGNLAFRYDAIKDDSTGADFNAEDNKVTAAIVMGVEKELGYGFGFGAELAGIVKANGKFKNRSETGEISQLYLTYKNNGTALKIGRQTLPKTVSPWAWSDRTATVVDDAFNAVTVVNTSLIKDTTLIGAWVHSIADGGSNTKIANDKGLFMLGLINKSVANTTLSMSAYFKPKGTHEALGYLDNGYALWASAETKINNFDLGLQAVYAKIKPLTKRVGVAAYVGTNFNGLGVKLTGAYIDDGSTPLALSTTSGFWGNVGYANEDMGAGSLSDSGKQKIVKLDLDYKLPENYGKIYGGVAYDDYSNSTVDKKIAARVGYGFKVSGIDGLVEYRYTQKTPVSGSKVKMHKIRVQGVYKF